MKLIQKRTYAKNYRELCDLLEIPFKTNSESRQKQIEEQQQFYIIVKHGSGFAVEKRKEPKPTKPKDKTRNGKYNKLMNSIVMNYAMNFFEPKPKHLIIVDLFDKLRFVSATAAGANNCESYIIEKYGEKVYTMADYVINAKIYDLLHNSLRGLSASGNIIVSQNFMLKDGKTYQGSDEIICELTKNMLAERNIRNEFELNKKSDKIRRAFYQKRNETLMKKYGFQVEKKVTSVKIIDMGSYKSLNPKQLKDLYELVFEMIKSDLIRKADNKIEGILNLARSMPDSEAFEELFGVHSSLTESDKQNLKDLIHLKELYEEFLKYE